jgi:hypothetical protein
VQARTEDRVAARYYAEMRAKGKQVAPPQMGPSATPAAARSRRSPRKQMAHSPTETKR